MISMYKNNEHGLEVIDTPVTGCWINVVDPTAEEIDHIQSLNIPQDFITYPLDMDERPRTQKEDDGTLLIVLRVPFYQGPQVDVPYTTIPLGIVLTDKWVITISRKPTEILEEFCNGRIRGLSTSKRNRFVLRLLLRNAAVFLNYLRQINKVVEELEDRLQMSMRNRELLDLLKYQKSLVYFTTALKSNELLMERLQKSQFFRAFPDDEDLLEDVITENQQAIEMTNISSGILSSMMDAFASIISNNLNVVMKFLASVTIILSLPTIVTSYFGMNVNLPFQDHPLAYLIIIVIFTALCAVAVIIFLKRDWF